MDNIVKAVDDITSGCRNIMDSFYFVNNFLDLYDIEETKNLADTFIYGREYTDKIDMRKMITLLHTIYILKYKEECEDVIAPYRSILSETQCSSVDRIIERKERNPNKNTNTIKSASYSFKRVSKNCPHCGHVCVCDIDIDYVVCGYHDNKQGFDWFGCGKDWCFRCGKKLCKQWAIDQLFVQENRKHNEECCKKRAIKNGDNYEKEYCRCSGKLK